MKLIYQPKDGRFSPGYEPGDELEVTGDEAKRLIETGLWAKSKPEKKEKEDSK